MGLRQFIPGTAEYSVKHHQKFLQKKASGRDMLVLVEWGDGKLTELGADVRPEMDGYLELTNGLFLAPVGEGVDPVDYYGVPTVRAHAQIACPFSTTACLQAEFDEAGEFQYVEDDDGRTRQVVEVDVDQAPDTSTNGHDDGEVATDGGTSNYKRTYDIRPPSGAVGHTFGLDEAKQRAPYPVSPNDIRRGVEFGKESERDAGEVLRAAMYGAGAIIGTIVVLGLLYIIGSSVLSGGGGGSSGSGSGTTLGLFLLAAGPTARADAVKQELVDTGKEAIENVQRNPKQTGLRLLTSAAKGLAAATLMIGYVLATLTGAVFWGEYLATHPTVASPAVVQTLEALFTAAITAPLAVGMWLNLRMLRDLNSGG